MLSYCTAPLNLIDLHPQARNPPRQPAHSVHIPDDELSVNTTCTYFRHLSGCPGVRANCTDRVLVHGQKLRLVTAPCAGHARKSSLAASVSIAERVEGGTVQAANGGLTPSSRRLGGRCIVKTANCFPASSFGTLEHHRLAVVTGCYQRVFRRPDECDIRQRQPFDGNDRRCCGVDDGNG